MKKLHLLLILFLSYNFAFGQTESELFKKKQLEIKEVIPTESRQQFLKTDFSKIWTQTENQHVFGFIGEDYQRMRIKFISVTKSPKSPGTYTIYGKTKVKGNVDDFHGTIKIAGIHQLKVASPGLENIYKIEGIKGQYMIIGDYTFSENKNHSHSGVFSGIFRSDFYIDRNNNIKYDDIQAMADGYINNQFVGTWTAYKDKSVKKSNWGDFRIPNSGDLVDNETGEFSPVDKYKKNGWETLHDSGDAEKKSKLVEDAVWWK